MGGALEHVLRDLGAPKASTVRSVFDSWSEIVGDHIAGQASPASLQEGRLVIVVTDPAWATEMRFLEQDILERLSVAFGPEEVTAIEVRVRRRAR
jgi:predicted nucleic acid-binding Zn ribbon protein